MSHTEKYYLAIKEGNSAMWDDMDEPGGPHDKWNKPGRETQILYVSLICRLFIKRGGGEFIEAESRKVVARGWGKGEMGRWRPSGFTHFLLCDEWILRTRGTAWWLLEGIVHLKLAEGNLKHSHPPHGKDWTVWGHGWAHYLDRGHHFAVCVFINHIVHLKNTELYLPTTPQQSRGK